MWPMHSTGPLLAPLPGSISLRGMGEIIDFESPVLRIEHDEAEAVATLWLDRAEARNAMGVDLWRDLPRAMAVLSADTSVRVVVVAAEGPHFSVGLDLKAMGGMLTGGGERWRRRRQRRRTARPWRPGPAAAAPRCSGCRTPSPPWPAAPSP